MDIFSLFGKITINYSDAVNNIEKVSKSAKDTAEKLEDVDKKADGAGESVEDAGKSAKNADGSFSTWKATLANLASNVITKFVSGCTNLAKSVVGLGTDFTATMSEVKAISGASDEQMKKLEETARRFGATTVFSATDAAEALKYMSLAGWDADTSAGALGGVLNLAAAAGMELGKASDMVTDYLSAFGMEADKSAYFADLLAYAQSHSNTTAEQLGEAYRNCAANLNAAGQDVETVTSLLEGMANQGLKSSEAGTALTAIMRDITNAMDDGAISIGDTTVAVADSNGNFRDLTDILKDVESATNGMGDAEKAAALSSTFTADSTKGLNLILNEGVDKITGYEDALRKSKGAAEDMSNTMNDNLKGDLANANSAFEELGLKLYDKVEPALREIVQYVTNDVVPGLTSLVENADKVVPAVVGIATALGVLKVELAISSLIKTATKSWEAYKAATKGATVAQWLLNEAQLASPAVMIIALIAGLVAAIVVLWNTNEDFRNKVIEIWNDVKEKISAAIESIKQVFTELADKAKQILEDIQSSVSEKLTAISEFVSAVWETIKNVVTVGLLFIEELINAAFQLITLPFQFIWENCKEEITAAWEDIKNVVSKALDTIKNTISKVWNAIASALSPILNKIKTAIGNAWDTIKSKISSVLSAIKSVITNVWNSIKTTVSGVMNSIKSVFSTAWDAIKTKISSVINSIKSVISSGLNAAKSTVSDILGAIKSKFSSIWDDCKSVVSNAIEKIKSVMHFSWSLPHLKMPHFTITGKFNLNPPSVPHFGIEWYKKAMDAGMIMNQPTIFGYNAKTGQLMGGGEAGSETVVGTQNLMSMIDEAVKNASGNGETETLKAIFLWMKNGGLRDLLIDVLTNYVEFDMDGREVGRLVRKYA